MSPKKLMKEKEDKSKDKKEDKKLSKKAAFLEMIEKKKKKK